MPSKATDFKKSNNSTPAAQWKKASGARAVDVELPSGNVAKLKQIPMPELLSGGIFPDSLQGYIQKAIGEEAKKPAAPTDRQPKKGSKAAKAKDEVMGPEDVKEMMSNPETVGDLFTVFDKVTLLAVVEPKVLATPADEADRDDNLLYVDEVDMEDKAFIFKFCVGGSKKLEEFRAESDALVGGMDALTSVSDAS